MCLGPGLELGGGVVNGVQRSKDGAGASRDNKGAWALLCPPPGTLEKKGSALRVRRTQPPLPVHSRFCSLQHVPFHPQGEGCVARLGRLWGASQPGNSGLTYSFSWGRQSTSRVWPVSCRHTDAAMNTSDQAPAFVELTSLVRGGREQVHNQGAHLGSRGEESPREHWDRPLRRAIKKG